MATLVLSTVGIALGGPVGGAIGSLIGQSIDQQLLAPATKGPRLGDLSVQTSSYGTQIPRIYGTMRVAGSIVWSTDLVESAQTSGAKGQPDVTYSYAVSFAVALSSRPLREIRRIWADGNLLRGAAGDLKVSTDFRFYDGSEDQAVDPLIGSVEGVGTTPAYRGLALAVFENLELATYGNRIPLLTFEVVGDEDDPTIGGLLTDVSGGCIAVDDARTLGGYAATGKSIRAAIDPIVETFDVEAVDLDGVLRSPASSFGLIDEGELGTSADRSPVARIQRDQDPARSLPASVLVRHYDASRDYQFGLARADGGPREGVELQVELPAVLSAVSARSLAEEVMARSWTRRDRLQVKLPPVHLGLLPGTRVQLGWGAGTWRVERSTIDGMAVAIELRPDWRTLPQITADAGRSNPAADTIFGPLSLALVELPSIDGSLATAPTVYLAASNATEGWKSSAVEVLGPAGTSIASTAAAKSILGAATTVLGVGTPDLVDAESLIEVQLLDADQWLMSCDDDSLMAGTNLAMIGSEILQFGAAEPLGGGAFRLSRLLRGRGGTEWAIAGHSADEVFLMLNANLLRQLPVSAWSNGSEVKVAQVGEPASSASLTITGDSLKPWSPVELEAAFDAGGDLQISWARRSRVRADWIDDVDMPLGEREELYDIVISSGDVAIEYSSGLSHVAVPAADLASLGSGPTTVQVRQIGDWGASRPAEHLITLA